MKNSLRILMAITMIFAFAGSAIAQTGSTGDCNPCKTSVIPNVQCPIDQGAQFTPFDYNGNTDTQDLNGNAPGEENYVPYKTGLCSGSGQIVFDLCTCEKEACDMQIGHILGVKIQIVTPGVYWAYDPAVTTNLLSARDINNNQLRFGFSRTQAGACNGAMDKYFTQVGYYNSRNVSAGAEVTPNRGTLPAINRANGNDANVILVRKPGGFQITAQQTGNGACKVLLDIPAMIVNPAEYKDSMEGQPIQIKISPFTESVRATAITTDDTPSLNPMNFNEAIANYDLNSNGSNGTTVPWDVLTPPNVDREWGIFTKYLCEDCHEPCSCTYTVGMFCCDAMGAYSLLYPYFADDAGESDYWNGVAITNLSDKAGTATLTIYEADGDVGTAKIDVPAYGVKAYLLSGIPGATITKKGTAAGAGTLFDTRCYIQVDTDFSADGFAMISDNANNGASMGYLPRQAEGN